MRSGIGMADDASRVFAALRRPSGPGPRQNLRGVHGGSAAAAPAAQRRQEERRSPEDQRERALVGGLGGISEKILKFWGVKGGIGGA